MFCHTRVLTRIFLMIVAQIFWLEIFSAVYEHTRDSANRLYTISYAIPHGFMCSVPSVKRYGYVKYITCRRQYFVRHMGLTQIVKCPRVHVLHSFCPSLAVFCSWLARRFSTLQYDYDHRTGREVANERFHGSWKNVHPTSHGFRTSPLGSTVFLPILARQICVLD